MIGKWIFLGFMIEVIAFAIFNHWQMLQLLRSAHAREDVERKKRYAAENELLQLCMRVHRERGHARRAVKESN